MIPRLSEPLIVYGNIGNVVTYVSVFNNSTVYLF